MFSALRGLNHILLVIIPGRNITQLDPTVTKFVAQKSHICCFKSFPAVYSGYYAVPNIANDYLMIVKMEIVKKIFTYIDFFFFY